MGQDLRFAIRNLKKNPGFATIVILTLALGVGAITAIFSLVYGVLLRPLPFGQPGRLVAVWTKAVKLGYPKAFVSSANYRDWRAQNHVFEDIALVRHIGNFNLTGDGEPERLQGGRFTANLLPILRVRPLLGRGFYADEEQPGRDRVVLLSHQLWQRRFGADPHVMGRSVLLNGEPHEVIGVMGPDFRYPGREFELWVPLTINPEELRTRLGYNFLSVARLKPGVTLERAQAEMDTIGGRLERQYPSTNDGIGVLVAPLREDTVSPVRRALYVLLGAVGCLLLIGCVNLTNLLLARATGRGRELTVRAALGASRRRLMRQALTEMLPIAVLGGALGLLLAVWSVDLLLPLLPASMPRVEGIGISKPVLAFTLSVSLLTALLAGLLPSLQASRTDLAQSLRENTRSASGGLRRGRIRDVLVISEVAMALILLISAGLLIRSFLRLRDVDPGFQTDRVLTMHLAIPRTKYNSDRKVADFCQRVLQRLQALPGVETAGMVNRLPLSGGIQIGAVEFEGSNLPRNLIGDLDWRSVTPDYFKVLRIPLLRGRFFSDRDTETAPPVGIVDERIARTVWPNQESIGKRFRIALGSFAGPWVTIVGIAGHIRHDGLDTDARPQVYWNYLQRPQDRMALVVRTLREPEEFRVAVVSEIRAIDPEQPVYDVRTMDEVVWLSLSQRWLNTLLLSIFAAVSMALASIGIYGVISYSVSQRVREFGIRMALGAQRQDVTAMIVRHAAGLTLVGTALGLAGAALGGRLLQSLLYGIRLRDPITLIAAPLVLLAVALIASYIPARRAMRMDPVTALRDE